MLQSKVYSDVTTDCKCAIIFAEELPIAGCRSGGEVQPQALAWGLRACRAATQIARRAMLGIALKIPVLLKTMVLVYIICDCLLYKSSFNW